ncbi:MAG: PTS sugar transporter subunit IIA [Candidatus Kapabacteria bacterium]|nr:PTS sugar transporter subunit IIA [Candidatus Kapabacteria bacterium]MCS7170302.1 PTS sugar transporter subunit IIA [Candidatus Kapabacteria bacterium]MDW7996098.1 PTS sugar transporter subunit IIA [Bacteroidota bacterium]MDW8224460.1 PTS sugar transporter subunit IIA [Bacteroidota bacterium]
MRLSALLHEQTILLRLQARSKEEVLECLIATLPATGLVRNLSEVRRIIFERENRMTTCIGGGVALPHGKTRAVIAPVAALATLEPPMMMDAPDERPVEVVFLLVGQEDNVGAHLRLLSRISRLMSNASFRMHLLQAQSPQDVLELFEQAEALHESHL